jgi:manganese/zinc/iron transport system permease protein
MIDSARQLLGENYLFLVILAGVSLLGAGAGIVGAFAVLRRRALTGDALSHAALPGVCLAFLALEERYLPALLVGALASGILGVAVISALARWTKVRDDAAIGIVLSVFFGLGIALLGIIQRMGSLGNRAGLSSFIFGKATSITGSDVWIILAAAAVCLAVIIVLYKEFLAVTFDADFTRSLGWPVYAIDLLLMSLVAAAVVIGLPSVGVIMISALLIMPGAAARFWTDRLGTLLILAGCFGFLTGVVGTSLSYTFDRLPTGPVIVLAGAALFLVSMLFGHRRGAIARLLAHHRFRRTWQERQLLRTLYELFEAGDFRQRWVARDDLVRLRAWSPAEANSLVQAAAIDGLVEPLPGNRVALTAHGWQQAIEVTRGHRLWQTFLTEYPEQAGSVANLASVSVDEHVPPALAEELQAKLLAAGRWPASEAAP